MLKTDPEVDGLLAEIDQQSDTARDFAGQLVIEFDRERGPCGGLNLDASERRLDLIRANLKAWLRDLLRWDTERLAAMQ